MNTFKEKLWHLRNIWLYQTSEILKRTDPDFISIGAQRSGTTFLESAINKHPNFIQAKSISLNYFSQDYQKSYRFYKSQFPSIYKVKAIQRIIKNPVITGEFKQCYLPDLRAAERVHKILPNIKIIAILRDPTQRAISHYFHNRHIGLEHLSLEEALLQEAERITQEGEKMLSNSNYYSNVYRIYSYKARSRYWEQLKPWYNLFPHENIFLLKSEDMFLSPEKAFHQLCNFLNIPKIKLPEGLRLNQGHQKKIPQEIIEELNAYFEPYNKTLFEHTGIKF